MKWLPAKLFVNEQTGTDELGNAITSPKQAAELPARFTPYVLKEQDLDGREITVRTRNILLRCACSVLPRFDFIEFQEKTYRKPEIQALGRFTLVILEGAK